MKNFAEKPMIAARTFLYPPGTSVMEFESASPAIVKSIKQRDLLNVWLRLYAGRGELPKFGDYRPERLTEEADDLVGYTVIDTGKVLRFRIDSEGTRMSRAYGTTGQGRFLDEYLGAKLEQIVIPVYLECVRQRLPVYTISKVKDIYGRTVDYERLLLPFSDGAGVTQVLASLKTISEDGGFEIKNLMRANDVPPASVLRSVIDRELYHKLPGRIAPGDTIEFV